MKKYISKFGTGFCSLLLLALMCLSCKKATNTDQPQQTNTNSGKTDQQSAIRMSHSWLVFPSKADLEKTLAEPHSGNIDLAKWSSGFPGYQSLRDAYQALEKDGDNLDKAEHIPYIPDEQFATLVSKGGKIQVADTIYCYPPGGKELYLVPEKFSERIISGADPATLPEVRIMGISVLEHFLPAHNETGRVIAGPTKPSTICNFSGGRMQNWLGDKGSDIYGGDDSKPFPEHNGRQVKLQYSRWNHNYGIYASCGVTLKMLKHTRLIGWQAVTYADEMAMEACAAGVVLQGGIPLFPFERSTSPAWPLYKKYAANKFSHTLMWNLGAPILALEHFNFHFKVNYRGRIVERDIRE